MPREIHGSRRPAARLNDQPLSAGEQDVLDNFLLAETRHRNFFGGGADEEVLTRLAAAEERGDPRADGDVRPYGALADGAAAGIRDGAVDAPGRWGGYLPPRGGLGGGVFRGDSHER